MSEKTTNFWGARPSIGVDLRTARSSEQTGFFGQRKIAVEGKKPEEERSLRNSKRKPPSL